ncbi:MAG: ATP-dependent RecD-like DNA helicase [Clostridia bacterium]|nr:ATP-dependent RecD-like DNA helicase [Clostridia bacterium]
MEEQLISITGTVENIVFYNEENGYCVCDIDYSGEMLTAVGCMPCLSPGETITLEGNFTVHPSYGKQFSVSAFQKAPPNSIDGIYKYLASGFIKGVRSGTAKKIVDAFGENSLDIIENAPEKLAEIKGISVTKAFEINEEYLKQFGIRNIVMFLQKYSISPLFAQRIFKKFGSNAVTKIKDNPYLLAEHIHGIGFRTCDKIALQMGITYDSPYRLKEGVKFVLSECSLSGHTYYPYEALIGKSCRLLGASDDSIAVAISELALEKQIVLEKGEKHTAVYLSYYYYTEVSAAEKLKKLNEPYPKKITEDLKKVVEKAEKNAGITLQDKQREAVFSSLTFPVSVITGGPGTGKTTVIKTIINAMELQGKKVVLAAPTGRAAKRMSSVTNKEAKTLHRLLETDFSKDGNAPVFIKNEKNPIEANVIIVDEMSMVDIVLFNSLLKAVAVGTVLILVGDSDQLPSVGPGNVLRDIIDSEGIIVSELTQIYRQSNQSMIVINAHMINQGEFPFLNEKGGDFFYINRNNPDHIINTIVDLCLSRLPKAYGVNPMTDIQILTPMRKNAVGVNALNAALQEALNPYSPNKPEKSFGDTVYRKFDKVMQTKNNYDIEWEQENDAGFGLYNGDIGIINDVNEEFETLDITFDDNKQVIYDFGCVNELELAYATTIHKSQGSEFPIVIIPIYQSSEKLMTRNLLYTAITRATKLVILVGSENILRNMINNNSEIQRFSGFKDRLLY